MSRDESIICCPLCGHEFSEKELSCHGGCPFGEHCQVACCPECGYQIVKETETVKWIRRFLKRSWKSGGAGDGDPDGRRSH